MQKTKRRKSYESNNLYRGLKPPSRDQPHPGESVSLSQSVPCQCEQ
jgi:hypothetical protein